MFSNDPYLTDIASDVINDEELFEYYSSLPEPHYEDEANQHQQSAEMRESTSEREFFRVQTTTTNANKDSQVQNAPSRLGNESLIHRDETPRPQKLQQSPREHLANTIIQPAINYVRITNNTVTTSKCLLVQDLRKEKTLELAGNATHSSLNVHAELSTPTIPSSTEAKRVKLDATLAEKIKESAEYKIDGFMVLGDSWNIVRLNNGPITIPEALYVQSEPKLYYKGLPEATVPKYRYELKLLAIDGCALSLLIVSNTDMSQHKGRKKRIVYGELIVHLKKLIRECLKHPTMNANDATRDHYDATCEESMTIYDTEWEQVGELLKNRLQNLIDEDRFVFPAQAKFFFLYKKFGQNKPYPNTQYPELYPAVRPQYALRIVVHVAIDQELPGHFLFFNREFSESLGFYPSHQYNIGMLPGVYNFIYDTVPKNGTNIAAISQYIRLFQSFHRNHVGLFDQPTIAKGMLEAYAAKIEGTYNRKHGKKTPIERFLVKVLNGILNSPHENLKAKFQGDYAPKSRTELVWSDDKCQNCSSMYDVLFRAKVQVYHYVTGKELMSGKLFYTFPTSQVRTYFFDLFNVLFSTIENTRKELKAFLEIDGRQLADSMEHVMTLEDFTVTCLAEACLKRILRGSFEHFPGDLESVLVRDNLMNADCIIAWPFKQKILWKENGVLKTSVSFHLLFPNSSRLFVGNGGTNDIIELFSSFGEWSSVSTNQAVATQDRLSSTMFKKLAYCTIQRVISLRHQNIHNSRVLEKLWDNGKVLENQVIIPYDTLSLYKKLTQRSVLRIKGMMQLCNFLAMLRHKMVNKFHGGTQVCLAIAMDELLLNDSLPFLLRLPNESSVIAFLPSVFQRVDNNIVNIFEEVFKAKYHRTVGRLKVHVRQFLKPFLVCFSKRTIEQRISCYDKAFDVINKLLDSEEFREQEEFKNLPKFMQESIFPSAEPIFAEPKKRYRGHPVEYPLEIISNELTPLQERYPNRRLTRSLAKQHRDVDDFIFPEGEEAFFAAATFEETFNDNVSLEIEDIIQEDQPAQAPIVNVGIKETEQVAQQQGSPETSFQSSVGTPDDDSYDSNTDFRNSGFFSGQKDFPCSPKSLRNYSCVSIESSSSSVHSNCSKENNLSENSNDTIVKGANLFQNDQPSSTPRAGKWQHSFPGFANQCRNYSEVEQIAENSAERSCQPPTNIKRYAPLQTTPRISRKGMLGSNTASQNIKDASMPWRYAADSSSNLTPNAENTRHATERDKSSESLLHRAKQCRNYRSSSSSSLDMAENFVSASTSSLVESNFDSPSNQNDTLYRNNTNSLRQTTSSASSLQQPSSSHVIGVKPRASSESGPNSLQRITRKHSKLYSDTDMTSADDSDSDTAISKGHSCTNKRFRFVNRPSVLNRLQGIYPSASNTEGESDLSSQLCHSGKPLTVSPYTSDDDRYHNIGLPNDAAQLNLNGYSSCTMTNRNIAAELDETPPTSTISDCYRARRRINLPKLKTVQQLSSNHRQTQRPVAINDDATSSDNSVCLWRPPRARLSCLDDRPANIFRRTRNHREISSSDYSDVQSVLSIDNIVSQDESFNSSTDTDSLSSHKSDSSISDTNRSTMSRGHLLRSQRRLITGTPYDTSLRYRPNQKTSGQGQSIRQRGATKFPFDPSETKRIFDFILDNSYGLFMKGTPVSELISLLGIVDRPWQSINNHIKKKLGTSYLLGAVGNERYQEIQETVKEIEKNKHKNVFDKLKAEKFWNVRLS